MNADTYQNKNITPAGDSNTSDDSVIVKGKNTYQSRFLIVAGSLLALLVVIAIAGPSGGQYLKSSIPDVMVEGTGALSYNEMACTHVNEDMYDNGARVKLNCCPHSKEVKEVCDVGTPEQHDCWKCRAAPCHKCTNGDMCCTTYTTWDFGCCANSF